MTAHASRSDQNNDRSNGNYMLPATPKGSAGYSGGKVKIVLFVGQAAHKSGIPIQYSKLCQIASTSAYVQISGAEVKDVVGGGAYDQFSTSM